MSLIKFNEHMLVSFLIEATVKPSRLQAFAHRPALARSKCGFENRIKNTFFIRSVSAYRELLIAAVLHRYHRATQNNGARLNNMHVFKN